MFDVSMPHAALWVVQLSWNSLLIMVFDVSMPHAALWVVQQRSLLIMSMDIWSFNAARGFVGGAAGAISIVLGTSP